MSDTILYHGQPNGPSLAVLAVLFETGLDIETRRIDLLKGERHTIPGLTQPQARDMDVEGEGPVLVIDGEAMTDCVFIAQCLDELAGGGLQPSDPYLHWQMLMFCRRATERGSPANAFLGCRAHSVGKLDMAALDSIVSDDLRARWRAVQAGDFPEAQVADSLGKLAAGHLAVDEQLGDGRDWLMGPLTIADFVAFGWGQGTLDLCPGQWEDKSRMLAWHERMHARPSVQRALALASVPHPEHSWAPGPEINRWG